jgi:hypothetical protein
LEPYDAPGWCEPKPANFLPGAFPVSHFPGAGNYFVFHQWGSKFSYPKYGAIQYKTVTLVCYTTGYFANRLDFYSNAFDPGDGFFTILYVQHRYRINHRWVVSLPY